MGSILVSRMGRGLWATFLICSSMRAASLPSSSPTPLGLISTIRNTWGLAGASDVFLVTCRIITKVTWGERRLWSVSSPSSFLIPCCANESKSVHERFYLACRIAFELKDKYVFIINNSITTWLMTLDTSDDRSEHKICSKQNARAMSVHAVIDTQFTDTIFWPIISQISRTKITRVTIVSIFNISTKLVYSFRRRTLTHKTKTPPTMTKVLRNPIGNFGHLKNIALI